MTATRTSYDGKVEGDHYPGRQIDGYRRSSTTGAFRC